MKLSICTIWLLIIPAFAGADDCVGDAGDWICKSPMSIEFIDEEGVDLPRIEVVVPKELEGHSLFELTLFKIADNHLELAAMLSPVEGKESVMVDFYISLQELSSAYYEVSATYSKTDQLSEFRLTRKIEYNK